MKAYAESSAVLRWLFAEDSGEIIRETLASADKVLTSRLTLIEVRRVMRRAVHGKRITAADAAQLEAVLADAAATWALLEITPPVAERAQAEFPHEPIRTLDAIHLASALTLRHSLPDLTVISVDDRIRSNADKLGLAVAPR